MKNPDNKTKKIELFDLTNYKKLLENNPCHIATVTKQGLPNLAVASDIKVLDNKTILVSNNEMIHTPDNLQVNKNCVLTSFSDQWKGLRLTGVGTYHTSGKYFVLCNQYFNNETATPKGAIVMKIKKVESLF